MKKWQKYTFVIGVLFSIAALVSCSDEPDAGKPSNESRSEIRLTAEEMAVAKATNHFGLNMLKSITGISRNDNFVFSPVSATMLTGMMANGLAKPEVEMVMEAFNLKGSDLHALNSLMQKTVIEMPSLDSKNKITFANSIWHGPNISINNVFSAILKENYNATDHLLTNDWATNQSKINDWCSKNTDGMIKEIGMDARVDLQVLNAQYFAGEWNEPFKERDTYKEWFHNSDGSKVKIRMMKGRKDVGYSEGADFIVVSLPYFLDSYKAVIIKPKGSVDSFITSLKDDSFEQVLQTKLHGTTTLLLPRLSLKNIEVDISNALRASGLEVLLTSCYSAITENGLSGSRIFKQISSMDVDESGTKAAILSDFGNIGFAPGMPTEVAIPNEVRIDSPFIFMVIQNDTQLIVTAAIISSL